MDIKPHERQAVAALRNLAHTIHTDPAWGNDSADRAIVAKIHEAMDAIAARVTYRAMSREFRELREGTK